MTLEIESYESPPGTERQYVVKVEDLERYVKTMSESGGFKEQFGLLRSGPQKPCNVGMKIENRPKNRYPDLLPYDDYRVVLRKVKNDPHSDYINASYIENYQRRTNYICTQGPLESTISAFWRMVWQEDINVICMTCNVIESGKKKCEKYWPDKMLKVADLIITLQSEKVFLDYTIRNFKIIKVGSSGHRIVHQYQYTAWPDHDVPSYPLAILNMIKDIKKFQEAQQKKTPWLLHCSAGVGRSGTVMVLDSAIEMSVAEGKIDVLGILYRMRQQRMNIIQTVDQYIFVYKALVEYHYGDKSCKPANEMVLYFNKLRQVDAKTKKTGLDSQFEILRGLDNPHFHHKCMSAITPNNKNKNRDHYIIPPDDGRPLLKTSPPSNYINAVYVYHYGIQNHFITTQYPLPNTLADFWQLVWDSGSSSVVVLNEFNNKDESSPIFWPQSGSVYQGSIKIQHISSEPEYYGGVLIRKFNIKNPKGKSRTVKTFHLHGWRREEFVPPQVDTIVQLIAKVDKWTRKTKPAPVIVSCYDGSRASGFYCASSYLAAQIYDTREVNVVQAVRTVRLHRPTFLPTVEQYRWLYELSCFLVSEKILK
ncbi:receptor-type tyrosine-protein phosphatase kappa [Parasteatoda tepidariorum]|uniref:receptor-type tyrosine-protein phosphatase kappa n=1 Tax=Parasteatoda tepidariorum TaxID=114398 RepID=UPI00077FA11E|nr:receptor-type tyrosine-protein phosphatase kappa [Parasteatoda tepidariorum]